MIIFLEYLYCLFYIFGLTYLVHKILDIPFKKDFIYKIIVILVYGIINYYLTDVHSAFDDDYIIRNVLVILTDFIFISFLMKRIKIDSVIYCIIYTCVFAISSIAMSGMLSIIFNLQYISFSTDIQLRFFIVVMINIFTLMINSLIIRQLKAYRSDNIPGYYLLIIIGVYSIFFILILLVAGELSATSNLLFLRIVILIIVLFIIVNLLVLYVMKIYGENQIYKIIDFSNKVTTQYVDAFNKQYQEMRSLRHDFRNHLDLMKELGKEKMQEDYSLAINEKLNKYMDDIDTNNLYINACLNMKKMDYPDIIFDVTTILDQDIGIDNNDFCTLFFNLLDNAIEATLKTDERKVAIKILKKEENLIMKVKNPQVQISDFSTSKGKNHGLGVKIINKIVKKYNGNIEYFNNPNDMTVYIQMNIAK